MPFREILDSLLTPRERIAWEACLARNARDHGKGADLIREGERPRALHVVLDGWAQKYKQLPDGRRQILALYLPGQLCDLDLFTVSRSDHSLAAIRRLCVAEIGRAEACDLLRRCPSLSQIFCWSELVAGAIQREWMISIGQRNAQERVAHLLCELYVRQRGKAPPNAGACDFLLTQWQIAEATGLTQVHVNRTIQELRRCCGVGIRQLRLELSDFEGLAALASFNANYLHFNEAPSAAERVAPLFEPVETVAPLGRLPLAAPILQASVPARRM